MLVEDVVEFLFNVRNGLSVTAIIVLFRVQIVPNIVSSSTHHVKDVLVLERKKH